MLDLNSLSLNPQLLAIWATAAVSFVVLLCVTVAWAVGGQKSDSKPKLPGQLNQIPLRNPTAWTTENLDSVIQLSGWEAPAKSVSSNTRGDSRSPRGKNKSAVTTKQRIIRAGIYSKRGVWTYLVVRVMACLVTFFSGLIGALVATLPVEHGLIAGCLACVAGYLAPSLWLDHRLRVRQSSMRRALPDALDLVTVCMQGGLSLPAALSRVSRELGTAHPMLATELAIVEREIQMGRTTGEAMRQFSNRFDLEELRSLSSVVGQAEKFGGSITGALRTYAGGLRIKRRQHAEEMAQKAAVKLLFPTLLCIFPGIFVVILGPTAIRIYQVMVEHPWNG